MEIPGEEEPLSIATAEHCFDAQFHPGEPLLAAAIITGGVELHRYQLDEKTSELVRTLSCHKESCRTARFLSGGSSSSSGAKEATAVRLATASASCFTAVTDIEQGTKVWKAKLRAAGNALQPIDSSRFVVGDDNGGIVLFDTRQKKAAAEYRENADFITDFALSKDKRTLCATSGDGTLAVYDLRKTGTKGLIAMSDFQEDEFLSVDIVRNGTKVVCGSQEGPIAIFSWGDFGDQKERLTGHPASVDAMVKIGEDGLLTGSSDGKVRVSSIYHKKFDNRVLGVVAEHGDWPVERIAISPNEEHFVSVSHGQPAIRLWPMDLAQKFLAGEAVGQVDAVAGGEDSDSDDDSDAPKGKKKKVKPPKKKLRKGNIKDGRAEHQQKAAAFFSGL